MPYSKNPKIQPIISDPLDLMELQFKAGPDAPKNKDYTEEQIFERREHANKLATMKEAKRVKRHSETAKKVADAKLKKK